VDPAITEICRRARISDYLKARGVVLIPTGRGFKCCCPLPGHKDDTPSFNITTSPRDGAEVFKCFGSCGLFGNIITLIHLMEKEKKGAIIKRLAAEQGVSVGDYSPVEVVDPLKDDIISYFCQEDERASDISEWCLWFLDSQKGNEDAVNKVSRIYQRLDRMIETGDWKGIRELERRLKNIIAQYQGGLTASTPEQLGKI